MGGFFGEEKDAIMKLIPQEFKVKSKLITNTEELDQELQKNTWAFPLVCKPNIGERGYGVKILMNKDELVQYGNEFNEFLIQEYIDYRLELGVLYSKIPGTNKGRVSSISEKRFISVQGDGESTVRSLVNAHPRHRLYMQVLEKERSEVLNVVPRKHVDFVVYQIGNHAKGTKFLDKNSKINEKVNAVFDKLNESVKGVYYGRYDLKVPTYEDLEKGQNIKVFELNGVSSEPGHIYDQSNIFKAHFALAKHWLRIIAIAKANIKKGVKTTPLKFFLAEIKKHFLN